MRTMQECTHTDGRKLLARANIGSSGGCKWPFRTWTIVARPEYGRTILTNNDVLRLVP